MDDNTKTFLDFWATYKWPDPKPILYRLYYDDNGVPIAYSQEDLPGKYIDLTPEQYAEANSRVLVRDGKLIKKTTVVVSKLVPSDTGTTCHPSSVSIVVNSGPSRKWNLKTV